MKCVQTIFFDIRGHLEISWFAISKVDCNFLFLNENRMCPPRNRLGKIGLMQGHNVCFFELFFFFFFEKYGKLSLNYPCYSFLSGIMCIVYDTQNFKHMKKFCIEWNTICHTVNVMTLTHTQ